jgi:hypothetical protein
VPHPTDSATMRVQIGRGPQAAHATVAVPSTDAFSSHTSVADSAVLPLLLLDVDGVLMPTGLSVPRGFERHSTENADIIVSRQHGVWLHDLAARFELVWASTWGDRANDTFGEFYGLGRLPIVAIGDLPRHGTRKLSPIAAFVGDRAVAWVDDEIYDDARHWAEKRSASTLLIRPGGSVGLSQEHYEQLKRFGSDLAIETDAPIDVKAVDIDFSCHFVQAATAAGITVSWRTR